MKTSQKGLDLIKRFEGFSARPYKCPAGKMTIGYGHVIRPAENLDKINPEQAETLLREDVGIAEGCIRRNVKTGLSQSQFDALVSFIYNVGTQAFEKSYLLRLLNQGDSERAARQFSRWVFARGVPLPGLIARRTAEKLMFLTDCHI